MKIVVCVKQTPDTAATVTVDDGTVSWGDAPLVLNPWDEYAVEEALTTKEALGGSVTAISLGPEQAQEALKQALAMGCDDAMLIDDPELQGTDTLTTSKALASAVQHPGDVDLVFFGRESVDSATGLTFAHTARILGWPLLSQVASVEGIDEQARKIVVERMLAEGRVVISAEYPAIVSVVKEINEPRYPSFMGIRKASKAEIPVLRAPDLDLTGDLDSRVSWPEVYAPPKIDTECEFIEGDTAEAIAERLADRLLEEKVI